MLARTVAALIDIARAENKHAKNARAVVAIGSTWYHVSDVRYINNRRTDQDGLIVLAVDEIAPHSQSGD